MKRRDLIALIGGAAVSWPLVARAQQPAKIPRVVFLSPADIPWQVSLYRDQLRGLGYIEGQNIRLDFRNVAGNVDRLPALAEKLVQEGDIDVIAAISTPAAATSFVRAAIGWKLGDAISVKYSIEVFKASATHTAMIASTMRLHSKCDR